MCVRGSLGRGHRRDLGQGLGPPGHSDSYNNKSLALGTVCSNTGGWLGRTPALPPPRFLSLSLQGYVWHQDGPHDRVRDTYGTPSDFRPALGQAPTCARPQASAWHTVGGCWDQGRGLWPQAWSYPSSPARSSSGPVCGWESSREKWDGRGNRQVWWVEWDQDCEHFW